MADNGIDIVAISPTGHFNLVVMAKLGEDLDEATAQLSDYMSRVGAEAGLVVGREILRILVDTYRGSPSIQVVGEFPIALARGLRIGSDAIDFEDSVQQWLESLQHGEDVAVEPLRSALAEHVLPMIAEGIVRAAGPRARVAAG